MGLSRERMLERTMASDASFDGRFIVGVHSTKIYCLPSCRARKPKPENIRFYTRPEEAEAAGLRACLKCQPDAFYRGESPDVERLKAAVAQLRECPEAFEGPEALAHAYGYGASKLYEDLRRAYGRTPQAAIVDARIDAAQRRLLTTETDVVQIGFAVGFRSASAYYDAFGRRTGLSPAAYRKLREGGGFTVSLPQPFPREAWLATMGRDPASVSERREGDRFRFAFDAHGTPAAATLEVGEREVRVEITPSAATVAGHAAVTRLLGLAQDPEAFEAHAERLGFGALVAPRRGMRIPQTPTAFDGLVWSIVGQQVNLPFTYTLRRRLAERIGREVAGLLLPPTAADVAALEPEALLPLQFSRRKAEYLVHAARLVALGELPLEAMAAWPAPEVERRLLAVRGLGPWATNYLMMRSLGFPDALPIGDTGLTAGVRRLFRLSEKPDRAEVETRMAPFSPYRSLATFHLWQSLGEPE